MSTFTASILALWQTSLERLAAYMLWPYWALETTFVLVLIMIIVSALEFILTKSPSADNIKGEVNTQSTPKGFRWFQFQYLSVYLTIMLADWLQGTNMYTLYSSYGLDVGALFLTGFLSSAVFGTFLGIYVDQWGRKLGCIVFCVLEIVINLVEHIPNMSLLLFGRVLGGLSTSLLFSAFESWMVSEHRKLGFPEELLASTFAISSWGNAFMAICAGFLAQKASDLSGDIGPFQVAIALTVVTLGLILPWRENYGHGKSDSTVSSTSTGGSSGASGSQSFIAWVKETGTLLRSQPVILYLGLSQAFFEGAIYTFVFMWVPSLAHFKREIGTLPTGLVFATFMLAMSIGGMLFGLLLPVVPGGAESLCVLVYIVSALAMAVPVFRFQFWWVYISFLVLEAMVGMFNSCGATLRSKYYPDSLQSTIMTVFRLPLNLLVCVGTLLTNRADTSIGALQTVLMVLAGMHIVAAALQIVLSVLVRIPDTIPEIPGSATAVKSTQTDAIIASNKRTPAKRKILSASSTTKSTTVSTSTKSRNSDRKTSVSAAEVVATKSPSALPTTLKSRRSRGASSGVMKPSRRRSVTPSKLK